MKQKFTFSAGQQVMHVSDSSKSSDSSRSSGASASVSQLLSYWQYYRRKFHLLWRALFICDHRGFTFHPSLNHHHYHHIVITSSPLSSNYHHLIITWSPQLVKITSLITSSGKVLKPRREKKKGVRLWVKVDLQYALLLHNQKIAWFGRPLWTLCTGGHCVHYALCTLPL